MSHLFLVCFLLLTLFKVPYVGSSGDNTLRYAGKGNSSGVGHPGHSSQFQGAGLAVVWDGEPTDPALSAAVSVFTSRVDFFIVLKLLL